MSAPRVLAIGAGADPAVEAAAAAAFGAVADIRDLPVPPVDAAAAGDGGAPDAIHVGFLPDAAAARSAGLLLAGLAPAVPRVVETAVTGADGVDRIDAETLAEIKRSVLLGASLLVASMPDARRLAGLPADDRDTGAHQVAMLLLTIGVDAVLIHAVDAPGACRSDLVVGDALTGGRLDLPCACAGRHGMPCGLPGLLAGAVAAAMAAGRPLEEAIRAAEDYARGVLAAIAPSAGGGEAPPGATAGAAAGAARASRPGEGSA